MIDFSKIQEITLGGKVVVSITDADGLALWNADKTDGFIRGTFNVTDATTSYPVVWRNYSAYEYALVDGEKIESPQTARTWTVGEHKVELKIKDGATNFSYMFYTLPYTSIDFSTAGLNKAKAYNFSYMVYSCKQLTELDLTPIDFSQATAVPEFYYMIKIESIKINSTYGVGIGAITSTIGSWFNSCNVLTGVDVLNWDVSNMTNLQNTFRCCYALEYLDLSTWNPVKTTSLAFMFNYCTALKEIVLGNGWSSMPSLTSAQSCFANCTSLKELDLTMLDLSQATNVASCLANCTDITEITLPKSFTKAQNVSGFFSGNRKLKKINNLSGLVVAATTLDSVFYYNYELEDLSEISEWDTSKVTSFYATFQCCYKIKSLNLSAWETSSVRTFQKLFANCTALESVNISGWDTRITTNISYMFLENSSLTNIIFGAKFGRWSSNLTLDLSTCGSAKSYQLTDATYESMLNIYDRASNNKTTATIKFSSKHNIPDGFIDKMTAKGYTITKS